MSNDLEDFLRRAAKKRQAKAAEQKQAMEPPRRVAPQYSNSRTERIVVVEDGDDEDVAVAEVVEDVHPSLRNHHLASLPPSAIAHSESGSGSRKSKPVARLKTTPPNNRQSSKNDQMVPEELISELVASLTKPGGVRQAILIREILERPVHRW